MNADAEQNIQHLRQRLEHGAEELTRSVLLRLLQEEENMLGLTQERLRLIDQRIAKLQQRISGQTKLTERFASLVDRDAHRRVLATLNDLMATYQIHRQRITAALANKAEQ